MFQDYIDFILGHFVQNSEGKKLLYSLKPKTDKNSVLNALIMFQEHHDLLVTTVPTVESALKV